MPRTTRPPTFLKRLSRRRGSRQKRDRWQTDRDLVPKPALGLDPRDEARIGQKNKIIRRWAKLARGHDKRSLAGWPAEGKRGTRPSAPSDQRTASTYIFGAICPAAGKGAGLVLPRCTTEAMTLHLAEIATMVAPPLTTPPSFACRGPWPATPSAHAILVLDKAGWHISKALVVPANITIVPLPAKSPELNPVENVWQFMRDDWLSNRVFKSYKDILDHCCFAWNKLIDQPWKIMSIGWREWAHQS